MSQNSVPADSLTRAIVDDGGLGSEIVASHCSGRQWEPFPLHRSCAMLDRGD